MDDWTRRHLPQIYPYAPGGPTIPTPTKQEFDALKREVEELKEKLKKARKRDIKEGVPDCEMKDSVDLIKRLAKHLGVDLEDILDGHKNA